MKYDTKQKVTYEYLKQLPLDKTYRFTLYHIIGSLFVVLSYNEDSNKKLYLDIFQSGYTDVCSFYNTRSKYQINTPYSLNKQNYKGLITLSKYIKEYIIKEINTDSEIYDGIE